MRVSEERPSSMTETIIPELEGPSATQHNAFALSKEDALTMVNRKLDDAWFAYDNAPSWHQKLLIRKLIHHSVRLQYALNLPQNDRVFFVEEGKLMTCGGGITPPPPGIEIVSLGAPGEEGPE